MNVYVTYEELKEYLQGQRAGELVKDDSLLKRFCIQSARLFDEFAERKFYPRSEVRYLDHPSDGLIEDAWPLDTNLISLDLARVSNSELWLDDDLLSLTTLTTNEGSTTISSSDYLLMRGDRYGLTPYNRIRLKPDGTTTYFSYTDNPYQANALTGIWGYHSDYSNAWEDSQDTVQNSSSISSSATSLTVSDADGADKYGLTPRFRVQQLLRIESEYLYVTAKDVDGNTLTVVRGVNGTTAASHTQGTQIDIFRPMPDLVLAMEMMATYFYKRRHTIGAETDRAIASPTGILIMPSRLPTEVKEVLAQYKRHTL